MKTFVQAKTLYGSLTNCQLYNFDTQTYEPIDLYTNVVTENVIFASIFKYTGFFLFLNVLNLLFSISYFFFFFSLPGEYVNSYLKTDEHVCFLFFSFLFSFRKNNNYYYLGNSKNKTRFREIGSRKFC